MDRYVTLGPVGLHLRCSDSRATVLVENVLRYLHAEACVPRSEPLLTLDLCTEAAPPLNRAATQPLGTFDNGFELLKYGHEVLLVRKGYQARLDLLAGTGTVHVPSDALAGAGQWVACSVLLQCLTMLLRRHQRYGLHAAALAHEGRGLLVAAAADSGKSTLAFRLVQSGWAYLSDDTVLLHPTPTHVEVQGLRSHFSLDPESEALFPELEAGRTASLLKEAKWAVNVEALYPGQRTEVCTPHGLLFPQIAALPTSRLVPLPRTDAFGLLLAQSALARTRLDGTREHLDVLARLASEVPAYRLYAGRDLLEDPSRAAALLTPLVLGESSLLSTPDG